MTEPEGPTTVEAIRGLSSGSVEKTRELRCDVPLDVGVAQIGIEFERAGSASRHDGDREAVTGDQQ